MRYIRFPFFAFNEYLLSGGISNYDLMKGEKYINPIRFVWNQKIKLEHEYANGKVGNKKQD